MSTKSRGVRDLLNLIENAPDRFLPVITQLAQDASELGEGARNFLRNRFGEAEVNELLNAPNAFVRQTFRGGVTLPKSSQSQFPSQNPAPRPRFGPNAEVATPAAVRQSRFPGQPSAPVPEFSSVATRRSRLGDAIDRGEINLTQKRAAPEETQIPQSDSSDPFQKLRDMYSRFQKDIGPGKGETLEPIDPIVSATQRSLGLRFPAGAKSIAEYTTSRGAVRQPGTSLGGQPYNPMAMASPDNIDVIRGANTMRLPDLDDLPDAPARIPQGQTEMFIAPGTIRRKETVDTMRPQGVQLIDFSRLSKQLESMSPVDKAKFLATAGLTPLGVGLLATRGENVSENASEPEMSEPPVPAAAPDTRGEFNYGSAPQGPSVDTPQVVTPTAETTMDEQEAGALNQNQEEILTALQQSDPASSAAIRAVAPKSPESYSNIGDYYRDRATFVKSLKDGTFQRIVDAIKADAGGNAENLGTWATANEANRNLAYDYAVRNQLVPELTQQTGEQVTTMTVGSEMGDNNDASAVGNANAKADNVPLSMGLGLGGDLERAAAIQANNEIKQATQPFAKPNLQRSQDLVQQYLMRRRGLL